MDPCADHFVFLGSLTEVGPRVCLGIYVKIEARRTDRESSGRRFKF